MPITDIAIFQTTSLLRDSDNIRRTYPPIQRRMQIDSDIYIEEINRELAEMVQNACEPSGYGPAHPRRPQVYSFVRDNAPEEPHYKWDSDERLQICMALSRLVHPTSISSRYSARVYSDNNEVRNIEPGPIFDFGADAWIANDDVRNWMTEDEASQLRNLFSSYYSSLETLPPRVKSAIWYLEYAFRTYYLDVRWPLLCIGFESLIHTDRIKSTRQFSKRVSKLAEEIQTENLNEQRAEEAYELRSALAHGQLLRDLDDYKAELYEILETVLREVLKKAILDTSFSVIFSSPDIIREKWPVS